MIRLGILTYFSSINYGAFLQTYALQEYLRNRYKDYMSIEIINFNMKIAHETYLNRIININGKERRKLLCQYELFLQARGNLCLSESKLISDEIDKTEQYFQGKYDIIIVGSDQVWKTNSFRGFPNIYWLNFKLKETLYMAYAVSGRNDYQKMSEELKQYIRESLEHYMYIGTRDEITRKELLKIKKREIYRNCDPIFLIPEIFKIPNVEKKKKLIKEKFKINNIKPIISIMISDESIGLKLYQMLKNENNVLYLYNINKNVKENNLVELSPFEWSDVIGISDLVITDYFHGVVFSIIHEIPFFAMEHDEKGRGKIENLLIENEMNDKFLYLDDYKEKFRMLIIDLYTNGRNEMRKSHSLQAQKTMKNERNRSNNFFDKLDEFVGYNKRTYLEK